nr:MAG TPA: tail protein [Caudoviricetes sp.]
MGDARSIHHSTHQGGMVIMENVRIAILSADDTVCAFLDNSVDKCAPYWDEVLHTYLQGSQYTFELRTLADHEDTQFIVEGNHCSFRDGDHEYYCTIVHVEKDEAEVYFQAYGLSLELTNEEVKAYKGTSLSFVQYIDAFGFEDNVITIGVNEVSDKRISNEWSGTETALSRLFSLANVFDAELEFVTELNDDYSLRKLTLNIYRKHSDNDQGVGEDKTGTIIRYGESIQGITKTADITELYTAIRPYGKDGLTIGSLNKTEYDDNGNVEYKSPSGTIEILAVQARDRFPSNLTSGLNDRYIAKIWDYDTDNINTLYGQALAELRKNCVPKNSYDVQGYIDGNIGDTYTIEDAEFKPVLYLQARIVEQEICFTDRTKCSTVLDNFTEIESQISGDLLTQMQEMINANKTYQLVVSSSDGLILPEGVDHTVLTAYVRDKSQDVTSNFTINWYKNSALIYTGTSLSVSRESLNPSAVFRIVAVDANGVVRGSTEVTCANVTDGSSSHIHIAYANSSDGRVDFSLTDSNRKFIGQYSDSKQYGSEDPTKYRWSAIKGEDGQSFVSAEEQFYYSTSQTELVGGEWFVGNVVYQPDKFLWKRWKCTYANPSEIKYTKAVFDNTWNEIDAKIGEIHTQVSQANVQSKEAVDKATQAQADATKANELANTANTQSSEAKQLAQEANTSTGNAQKQIDAIKGDINDSKQQIQDAVDKANANAGEIATVKETYATKVDLTTESKTIHADVSTEIEKKVGELSTTVSETYASKSDLTSIEGSLNTKIKQNADSITTQASSIEKLQSDTTQAQLDITEATKKATDAQTQASAALSNAQSAQTLADEAKKKADSAQTNLDNANQELADAKANLESVTGRVDATEGEITKAQTRLTNAEAAVQKAQSDATKAQGNATTAISNAKTAQGVADDAKQKAEQAQKDLAELTNKVTSNTTKIEQNANAIKLQAKSITETSNKVDNLQIGGRNLLRNTAFNTFNYWTIVNANASIVDGWCEVTINDKWSGIIQNFKPEKGVDYIISYEAYLVDTEATSAFFECDFGSPDDKLTITKTPTKYTKKVPYPINAINYINFQLQSNEVGKKWRIRNIKLEKGNKATDWTPAPEDVDKAINTERTERQSAIETKANEITSKVSETYVSNSALNHYKEEVSTQFTQTKKDFTWSINQSVTDAKNEMGSQIDSVNGRVDGLKQTTDNVNSYMSFDNDGLTLGKSDSAFKTKITNEEWSIQKNGAKVTYINDQTMYITDGQFTQSLKVGAFGFVPRANGSLDFKKVG